MPCYCMNICMACNGRRVLVGYASVVGVSELSVVLSSVLCRTGAIARHQVNLDGITWVIHSVIIRHVRASANIPSRRRHGTCSGDPGCLLKPALRVTAIWWCKPLMLWSQGRERTRGTRVPCASSVKLS